MSCYIVITTIHLPSKAIEHYASMQNCKLVVVADKKTPDQWRLNRVSFLSVQQQQESKSQLGELLPFNHYARKMMGYLFAIKNGATKIIDTDDDNIPKEGWSFPDFSGNYDMLPGELGFVNIYQLFTKQLIWPRGLPLSFVREKNIQQIFLTKQICKVGIWQALADEDPDVDAIYRLTNNVACNFEEHSPVVLGKKTISPINSQNTIFEKKFFALLYLPSTVTFRFTDILRGLVAQPILWLYDYHIGFMGATVIQQRNEHDYMKDFSDEIPMYLHSEKIISLITPVLSSEISVSENLILAYTELTKNEIVQKDELIILDAWLKEIHANNQA